MPVFAQGGFAYQVVMRDADGHFIANQTFGMKFKLMKDNVVYYEETQKVVSSANGQVSVTVGEGDASVGTLESVPWNSLNIMLKVDLDMDSDGTYTDFAELQIQPVPYALYAASTEPVTEIVADAGSDPDAPLFSVKDKDGNLVFAVYRDGVQIFVDDTVDASKAMARGFAVSGRKATKDAADDNIFVVDATGTQVYVDDSKAMARGFAVSGRKATKSDEVDDLFVVNADGTQVYIDDDASKAMARGFAVSGRKATKDDENLDFITVNAEGTQVFVGSEGKAMARGFAVSGKKATKDGDDDNLFVVDAEGTQVYIDSDDSKAMARGFAVSGHKATKDDVDDDILSVSATGTQVFVDTDDSKAMARGFAVSGRKATKDSADNNLFVVGAAGTQIFIDDYSDKAMARGFAVSGHKATKDVEQPKVYMAISDTLTAFYVNNSTDKPGFSIMNLNNGDTLMAVANQNVDFGAPIRVNGDIRHSIVYDTLTDTLCVKMCSSIESMTYYIKHYYADLIGEASFNDNEVKCLFVHNSQFDENSFTPDGLPKINYLFDNGSISGFFLNVEEYKEFTIDSLSLCFVFPNKYEYRLMPLKLIVKSNETLEKEDEVIKESIQRTGKVNYEIHKENDVCHATRYFMLYDTINYIVNANVWEYEWETGDRKGHYVTFDRYAHDGTSFTIYDECETYKFSELTNTWEKIDDNGQMDLHPCPALTGYADMTVSTGNTKVYGEGVRHIGEKDYNVQLTAEGGMYTLFSGRWYDDYCFSTYYVESYKGIKLNFLGGEPPYSEGDLKANCIGLDFDYKVNFSYEVGSGVSAKDFYNKKINSTGIDIKEICH